MAKNFLQISKSLSALLKILLSQFCISPYWLRSHPNQEGETVMFPYVILSESVMNLFWGLRAKFY